MMRVAATSDEHTVDRGTVIQSDVVAWAVIDGILVVMILCGNTLTILAVRFSRRLRSVISNLFVLSLAISDMVVGFTIPYHLAFYMGAGLGDNKCYCLLRFFLIILACCVSIWNLIAIAVDRYIAIVYPLHYSRYMTRKVALILLAVGWAVAIFIAVIPVFWNNWPTSIECEFDQILPPWYMAGVIAPLFSMVWVCLSIVYWRIWREASKHAKQLRSSFSGPHEGPSDWKSVQVVLLILGCFTMCWLPYLVVACAQSFKFFQNSSPTLYKAAFSLAMANSGMNPIIYAWKNTNFRRAFGRLLKCKGPDSVDPMHSMRSNLHRKSSSLHNQETINGSLPNYSTPPPFQKSVRSNGIEDDTIDTIISITNINGNTQIMLDNETNINIINKQNNIKNQSYPDNNKKCIENQHNNKQTNLIKNNMNTQKLNNEITMGNIIINKSAIIENSENGEKELFVKNLNLNEPEKPKPIECIINEQNATIMYKNNLVNEQTNKIKVII